MTRGKRGSRVSDSERQKRREVLLRFMVDFFVERGSYPSIFQLVDGTNLADTTLYRMLKEMVKENTSIGIVRDEHNGKYKTGTYKLIGRWEVLALQARLNILQFEGTDE